MLKWAIFGNIRITIVPASIIVEITMSMLMHCRGCKSKKQQTFHCHSYITFIILFFYVCAIHIHQGSLTSLANKTLFQVSIKVGVYPMTNTFLGYSWLYPKVVFSIFAKADQKLFSSCVIEHENYLIVCT